jgi:hypothetical protein
MNSVSKFVKKNKVLVAVGAVVLLAVILAPSLYYGLKKSPTSNPTSGPTSNPTSSPASNPTSSPTTKKFINIINQRLLKLNSTNVDTNNIVLNITDYNSVFIYIKIGEFSVKDIDLTNVERSFFEIVRLVSMNDLNTETNSRSMDFIAFNEVINTNNRMLAVSSHNNGTTINNNYIHKHASYTNKNKDYNNITIEIKIGGLRYIDYTYLVSYSPNPTQKIELFKATGNILYTTKYNRIDKIILNTLPILPVNYFDSEIYTNDTFVTILSDPSKIPDM